MTAMPSVPRATVPSALGPQLRRTDAGRMDTRLRTFVRGAPSVSIRLIEPSDAGPLRAFYAGLSAESRRTRFLGGSAGISAAEAERFAAELGVGAVLHEHGPRDGELVGHACLPLVEPGVGEIAFAVADEFQGHGIGRRLLQAAIRTARDHGIVRLAASMFVGNPAIHRLLLGTGLPHRRVSAAGGVDGIEIELVDGLNGPVATVTKGTSRKRERPAQRGRSARSSGNVPAVR